MQLGGNQLITDARELLAAPAAKLEQGHLAAIIAERVGPSSIKEVRQVAEDTRPGPVLAGGAEEDGPNTIPIAPEPLSDPAPVGVPESDPN